MSLDLMKVETKKIYSPLSTEEENFIKDNFQTEPDSDFIYVDENTLEEIEEEIKIGLIVPENLFKLLKELVSKEKEGYIHVVMEY